MRKEEEEEEEEEEQSGEEEEEGGECVVLEQWRWNADGTLSGHVFGKRGFRPGELITTSFVPEGARHDTHV
eukprot:981339-Prymnesium_polylepis.1